MSLLLNEALKWVGKLHDGPDVPRMAREIAQVFPRLKNYCAGATNSTKWCGIFQAWLLSKFKIEPPHGDDGEGGFMYVDSFAKVNWGGTRIEPGHEQPGDIICLSSPHHITMLKEVQGDHYVCVGGNQHDGVTIAPFAKSGLMAIIRPPESVAIGVNPGTGTVLRPLVKMGDVGATVSELQALLGVAVDGEFGPDTDAAVRAFQAAHGLDVDGEVGDDTWAALMAGGPAKPTPASDVPHAAEYADYWRRMTILPEHARELDTIARKLIGNKSRYQTAQAQTGVPWFMIAVLHQRESSASFSRQLAQGDPINQVSTNVPAGRGPFPSWEASAVDALVTLKHLDQIKTWPIERVAYECERYNGFGYRNHSVPSAYLWSFSNIYRGGKYIKDGPDGWSPTTFDQQCGTMPMLKQMMALDASIVFASAPPPPTKPIEGEILDPLKPGEHEPPPIDRGAWGGLIAAAMLFFMEQKMTGQAPDLTKLFELIENPVLHKLFSGGAVTRAELRTLPGAVLASLGHSQPALPAPATTVEPEPVKQSEPVKVEPAPASVVVTPAPSGILPGLAGGLSITGLIAYLMDAGSIGTPFGMGQAPTSGGSLGAIIGALSPVIGAATGSWWMTALGKVGPILSAVRAASKTKTT